MRIDLARELTAIVDDSMGCGSAELFREAALARLIRVLGADEGLFIPANRTLFSAVPPLLRAYAENHVYQENLAPARAWAARHDGAFVDGAVYSRRERETLPIFRDSLRPAGVRSLFVWAVSFRGQPSGFVHVYRKTRGRELTADDVERIAPLLKLIAALHAALEPGLLRIPAELRSPLSPREGEIADLVARGYANLQIAAQLEISTHTVRHYLESIFTKLRVGNRTELAIHLGGTPVVAPGERQVWAVLSDVHRMVGAST